MRNTTLCYIEKDGKYLMLHRVKKENDENKDKWVGIGGKFEQGESPEECMLREAKEETGLDLINPQFCGIVTFVSDKFGTEYMHLFKSCEFSGSLIKCDEGNLEWVDKNQVKTLPIWKGDLIFFDLIEKNSPFFSLKLEYKGDVLINAVLDGKKLSLEF